MFASLVKTIVFSACALAVSTIAMAQTEKTQTEAVPAGYPLGEEDAPVTIYEFASVTCGHCKHFHDDIMPILKEEYINTGKVRFEFRPYALNQFDVAIYALTECTPADDFFEITYDVFETQDTLIALAQENKALDYLLPLATKHGIDGEDAFMSCVNDNANKATLQASMASADSYGVTGTPSLIVNGQLKRADSDLKDPGKFRAYMDRIVAAATATPAQPTESVTRAIESVYQSPSN